MNNAPAEPSAAEFKAIMRAQCEAALEIVKVMLRQNPHLAGITYQQMQAEIAALPPGCLAELEERSPGFTFLLWLAAAYTEHGFEITDGLVQQMSDRTAELAMLPAMNPN